MQEKSRTSVFQIAFLVLAVHFLAAPVTRSLLATGLWPSDYESFISRLVIFATALIAFLAIPRLRRASIELLAIPIPRERRKEVALVAAAHALLPFAIVGSLVLWYRIEGGGSALANLAAPARESEQMRAFSSAALLLLPIAWFIGPLVEEIVFRGFMFRTCAERWGWIPGMLATSIMFGIYHPFFIAAFSSSIVFTCIYRRTGSLWSSFAVHAVANTLLWYPFVGQFVFPAPGRDTSGLASWWFHVACLAVLIAAMPIYIWMSRDSRAAPSARSIHPLSTARA
jgi:membrane protease YdiL (CAAX protease family)